MSNITLNSVEIMGNLAADPEMRIAKNGKPYTFFTVATSVSYTDAEDKQVEKTEYHDVSCWNGVAEAVAQYKAKGHFVRVEGSMHYEAVKKELVIDGKKMLYKGEPIVYWDHNCYIRATRVVFFPKFEKHTVTAEGTTQETVELSNN